jgi:hypothetical protein
MSTTTELLPANSHLKFIYSSTARKEGADSNKVESLHEATVSPPPLSENGCIVAINVWHCSVRRHPKPQKTLLYWVALPTATRRPATKRQHTHAKKERYLLPLSKIWGFHGGDLWRMRFSGMRCCVVLVWNDVSEEYQFTQELHGAISQKTALLPLSFWFRILTQSIGILNCKQQYFIALHGHNCWIITVIYVIIYL